jgi:predicted metalloprotease
MKGADRARARYMRCVRRRLAGGVAGAGAGLRVLVGAVVLALVGVCGYVGALAGAAVARVLGAL